jgi:hypothetical protein
MDRNILLAIVFGVIAIVARSWSDDPSFAKPVGAIAGFLSLVFFTVWIVSLVI